MKRGNWIFILVVSLLVVVVGGQVNSAVLKVQAADPQPTPAPEQEGLVVLQGLESGGITSIAFAPGDPGQIYAGGEHGIFRSTDGGRSWQFLSAELRFPRVLLIHPADPRVLFASRQTLANERGRGTPGVYKSTDGGISWRIKDTGLEQQDIFGLSLDASEPQTLYAGGRDGQVFRSTDGGETWKPTETRPSLPGMPPRTVIQLLVHPTTGDLYAVEDHLGIFRSTDEGKSWTLIHRGSGQLVLESQTDTLYLAGWKLWASSDQGETWQDITGNLPIYTGTGMPMITWLGVNPDPLALYVGQFHRQVYRSLDGGQNWTLLNPDVPFAPVAIKVGKHPELYGSAGNHLGRYLDMQSP